MSHESRSTAEIERDIERERAALAQSLGDLQDRFSVEGVARQVTDQVVRHGGDLSHSVGRSVKDNPIALALTGVGLAWLIYSDSHRNAADGSGTDGPATTGLNRPHTGVGVSSGRSTSASAMGAVKNAGAEASRRWDRMSSEMNKQGQRARASAADLYQRLHEGTENMSEEARDRVVKAREAAYRAQLQVEHAASRAGRGASDLFHDQPLLIGALAIAAGAALGSVLPRTKAEDSAFGEQSDHVFEEAERIFSEEHAKAQKVGSAVASEVKTVAKEESPRRSQGPRRQDCRAGRRQRGQGSNEACGQQGKARSREAGSRQSEDLIEPPGGTPPR
ncbi:DUF3618 domain-containing protein [Roseibium salinum]|uniref:DUF3618 domain-containing protein n=1 Tax=Roseibium salinum TaxID=1604349 RepID=UPI00361AB30F